MNDPGCDELQAPAATVVTESRETLLKPATAIANNWKVKATKAWHSHVIRPSVQQ